MSGSKTILILGGGVGGLVTAVTLRKKMLPASHRIILLDRESDHLFQPSLLWIMTGARRAGQIVRPLDRLASKGIEVIRGSVESIDPKAAAQGGRFRPRPSGSGREQSGPHHPGEGPTRHLHWTRRLLRREWRWPSRIGGREFLWRTNAAGSDESPKLALALGKGGLREIMALALVLKACAKSWQQAPSSWVLPPGSRESPDVLLFARAQRGLERLGLS